MTITPSQLNELERLAKAGVTHRSDVLSLIAEVRRLQVHREGSGTPSARLNYMLGELNQRFPLAVDVFSSEPAEPKFIAAIDELIAEVRRLQEDADRYRWAISREDNAESLYAAVMNNAPEADAIGAEIDAARKEKP
jgi:hypothetical protein